MTARTAASTTRPPRRSRCHGSVGAGPGRPERPAISMDLCARPVCDEAKMVDGLVGLDDGTDGGFDYSTSSKVLVPWLGPGRTWASGTPGVGVRPGFCRDPPRQQGPRRPVATSPPTTGRRPRGTRQRHDDDFDDSVRALGRRVDTAEARCVDRDGDGKSNVQHRRRRGSVPRAPRR